MAQMLYFPHPHILCHRTHLGITQHWRIEKCLKPKKGHSSSNKLNLIQTDIKVVQVFKVSEVSCNGTTDNSGRHTMHYSLHSWYNKVSFPVLRGPWVWGTWGTARLACWTSKAATSQSPAREVLRKPCLERTTRQPHAVRWHLAASEREAYWAACKQSDHFSVIFPVSAVHRQPTDLPKCAYLNWPNLNTKKMPSWNV